MPPTDRSPGLSLVDVTLTHSCPNAFADSAGIFNKPPVIHGGLSPLGRDLIYELNRLGVMVVRARPPAPPCEGARS